MSWWDQTRVSRNSVHVPSFHSGTLARAVGADWWRERRRGGRGEGRATKGGRRRAGDEGRATKRRATKGGRQNGGRRRAGDEGRATAGALSAITLPRTYALSSPWTNVRKEFEGRNGCGLPPGRGSGDIVDRIARASARGGSIAGHLRRSAESIVLNIAEGAGHYSPGRMIYHYQLARGSAGECIAALTHLYRASPPK
jgi:hypothetical protein